MARVEVSGRAAENLDHLIAVLSLPADTRARVRRALRQLETFPRIGPELEGRWKGLRFVLGPWRWMIVVYKYFEEDDRLVVLTIQDARGVGSATSARTRERQPQ